MPCYVYYLVVAYETFIARWLDAGSSMVRASADPLRPAKQGL